MLTRRAKAYSSSCLQTNCQSISSHFVAVHSWSVRWHSVGLHSLTAGVPPYMRTDSVQEYFICYKLVQLLTKQATQCWIVTLRPTAGRLSLKNQSIFSFLNEACGTSTAAGLFFSSTPNWSLLKYLMRSRTSGFIICFFIPSTSTHARGCNLCDRQAA